MKRKTYCPIARAALGRNANRFRVDVIFLNAADFALSHKPNAMPKLRHHERDVLAIVESQLAGNERVNKSGSRKKEKHQGGRFSSGSDSISPSLRLSRFPTPALCNQSSQAQLRTAATPSLGRATVKSQAVRGQSVVQEQGCGEWNPLL